MEKTKTVSREIDWEGETQKTRAILRALDEKHGWHKLKYKPMTRKERDAFARQSVKEYWDSHKK